VTMPGAYLCRGRHGGGCRDPHAAALALSVGPPAAAATAAESAAEPDPEAAAAAAAAAADRGSVAGWEERLGVMVQVGFARTI
jgi:hypothetical protein